MPKSKCFISVVEF
ncbi:hypothetical protein MTR67_039624 [Solanum verrucosum]|uniref:Uncharacterized protein n=1 Tax=Solanum verrucosum TaxID=315347 RepID=A0AAF0UI20_SOLVR|nr:hypothetical protein MTR67_039624 [Solanum verrucosum]